jgi:hypothetical protein
MEFLLLIYDQEKRWTNLPQAEAGAEMEGFVAFGKNHGAVIRGGNALQPVPTAKTVRVRNGQMAVTDGPFAETKEQLGGYYLIEAKDADEAAKIAADIPWAKHGSIEVRPIMKY